MTLPQQVTERYISNLLHYGRNREFDIVQVTRKEFTHGDSVVGVYFETAISHGNNIMFGHGATVSQALRRALEKHGVTFR